MLRRLLFPFFFTLAAALHAQTVHWEPGAGTLALNQLSELSLVFEQCEPDGTLTLPKVPGLEFGQPNRSQSSSFVVNNSKTTSTKTVTYTFRVRPSEQHTLRIPAFTVETDKGSQPVAAATFEVGAATVGQSGQSLENVAQSRFTIPANEVWAGEVFPLTYSLNASKRYLYNLNKDFDWDTQPLTIEPWSNPDQIEAMLNNEPRISVVYKTRALVKTPGTFPLKSATQLVNISTGNSGFGLFSRANLQQFEITSQPASLTVKPLPSPAPAGFTGAVGKFTLDSKVVPATAAVGEPITWTLTLDGIGNWPDIAGLPSRSVSKDFRIVQPQAKRTPKDGSLFDASITEDIVLIPTKPGTYTLGPVTFTLFNPVTGAYETQRTEPVTITVSPGATTNLASTSATPTANTTGPSDSPPAKPAVERASAPSASIPRDPLPPGGTSLAPLTRSTLVLGLLLSALLPLTVWYILALRRARVTDPGRPLREAHQRLALTIRELNAAHSEGSDLRLALQRWQTDTSILWRLPIAVPTSAHFSNDTWSTLWAESDRTLYSEAALPADWCDRALQALPLRRAPSFSVFQLLLARNLLPLFVLIASLVTAHTAFADDARDAYEKGDFATAGTAWSDTLKTAPTDWSAHHNLSLALIQQDHAGEAAGHALAAFVQQPQNPSVDWHLGYAFKNAGVTPLVLKPFLTDAPAAALARLASPTRWQFALIASAWLSALAISLGLYGAYRKRSLRWVSIPLMVVSLLLAAASGVSLHIYGPLTDTRAVIVVTATTLRSIPTDVDAPQKSTALAVGVIANTDKAFLGWRRLVFTDGQTGWVRVEALVPLWR
ncbi:MAG: BatD family protein [Opitutaceae bacterium]